MALLFFSEFILSLFRNIFFINISALFRKGFLRKYNFLVLSQKIPQFKRDLKCLNLRIRIIIGSISEMDFSLNKILPVSVPEADFSFPIAFGLSATCTGTPN